MRFLQLFSYLFTIVFFLLSCEEEKKTISKPLSSYDLSDIQKKGELIILTENSSTSYFNYRGKIMGFEYEILKDFASSLNLKLKVKVVNDSKKFNQMLNEKKGDIIACNYTITKNRSNILSFSKPYLKEKLVLVQRKLKISPRDSSNVIFIRDLSQLNNQTIYVRKHSSYKKRIENLEEELGINIKVKELSGDPVTEDYIQAVSKGKIDFTISEENIAKIVSFDNLNLDIKTPISLPMSIAFALRQNNPVLLDSLNNWLSSYMKTKKYKSLVNKYYVKRNLVPPLETKKIKAGQLSIYDDLFKKSANTHGVDWLLVSSVAFQETRFEPNAIGLGGAYSIMQFMPNTGPSYGVYPDSPVNVQIDGGTKMIKTLLNRYKNIPSESDRIKFALAAYNAGFGHIDDAMKLAGKYDLDPYKWDDNVKVMFENLTKPEFYRDPATKCGAYRGHAVRYAEDVYERYINWKNEFK